MMRKTIFAFAFLTIAHSAISAPITYPLSLTTDGRLSGAGADVLRAEIPKAQFILWGEDHGFADSAILLRALARDARPFGFKYHVVEVGPLSTHMLRDALKKDGPDSIHTLVRETPLGVPFLNLKDDTLLASGFLGSDAKGTPYLWGVDQEFIGSPPFHLKRLVEVAPNAEARAAASKLLSEEQTAAAKADQQNFLLVRFHESDFDALAAKFKGSAEAQKIIAEHTDWRFLEEIKRELKA